MRLSEMVGAEAVDKGGNALGEIHDVRLREATDGDAGPRFVVDGVLVGVGAVAARLGYAHGQVGGPALLAWALRRLARRAHYVPRQHVTSFEGNRLLLGALGEALVHPSEHRREQP